MAGLAPEIMAALAGLPVPPPPAPPAGPPPAPYVPGSVAEEDVLRRVVLWLAKAEPGVQGQNGSAKSLAAAGGVCIGFGLGVVAGCAVLAEHYNPRCQPPWSDAELRRLCDSAVATAERPMCYLLAESFPARPAALAGAGQRARFVADAVAAELVPPPVRTGPTGPPEPSEAAPPPPPVISTRSRYLTAPALVANCRPGDNPSAPPDRLTIQTITRDLTYLTGGWPKVADRQLFAPALDGGVWLLPDATELFAWIAQEVGHSDGNVNWNRGDRMFSQVVFHRYLFRSGAERFAHLHSAPHEPPVPDSWYHYPTLPAGGNGTFDRLLSFFRSATAADEILVRAFLLTLVWGGLPGTRPMFVVEADHTDTSGQGVGKSTLVEQAGALVGGLLSLDLSDIEGGEVQRRLLSPEGRGIRVVAFDNAKGTRLSNGLIEGYVTAKKISGRQMFVGEGSRANFITWVVTANQPSFSRDFVQRIIPIRLARPDYTPDWNDRVTRFVAEWRWHILADMLHVLRGPVVGLPTQSGTWGRWASWQAGVLAKAGDPAAVAGLVSDRRIDLDDDAREADTITRTLWDYIRANKSNEPDRVRLRMPAQRLAEALRDVSPHGVNRISTPRWLAAKHVPAIQPKKDSAGRRYWLWVGVESEGQIERDWDDIPN